MPERAHTIDRESRWLSRAALICVALAAVMGWAASFVGLQDYGLHKMNGFTPVTAWFIPGAFDGAAFGTSLITYRASINGRSALRGRVLMWAFTAVSSGINYIHQPDHTAQLVAAGLPMAAVAVFDIVLLELRADYEARHGKRGFRLRPGLLVLRWLVDRTGTKTAFRGQVMAIPVEEIAGLGNPLLPTATAPTALNRTESPDEPTDQLKLNNSADTNDNPPTNTQNAVASSAPARTSQPTSTGQAESPAHTAAETQQIPVTATNHSNRVFSPGPDAPLSDADKRAAARRDYLVSLDTEMPVTGAQLGARYGFSARWGREQIRVARQLVQREQPAEGVSTSS